MLFFKKINSVVYIMILFLNIWIAQYNRQIDIHYSEINNIILFIYLSLSNSVSLIRITENLGNKKDSVLSFFGKNSLIVMLTHYTLPLMYIAQIIYEKIVKINNEYVMSFIQLIIVLIFEYVLILIIQRKLHFLINYNFKNNHKNNIIKM